MELELDDLLNDDIFSDKKPSKKEVKKEDLKTEESDDIAKQFKAFNESKVEEAKPTIKESPKEESVNSFSSLASNVVEEEVKEELKMASTPNLVANRKEEETGSSLKSENSAPKPTSSALKPAEPKSRLLVLTEKINGQIQQLTEYNNERWTDKEKAIATNIISLTDKVVRTNNYSWKQIDMAGNDVYGQIKHWAKLGIDGYDYLHPMVRANRQTGLVDLTFEAQYQTFEKLIVKYCDKNVFNFVSNVVCVGDKLEYKFDYLTGEDVLTDFVQSKDRNPNNLDNILGAFAIAYYKEDGKVKQIVEYIDKERIMQAYKSAKTHNVWDNYTETMVKKTAIRCLFKGDKIRPFMHFPDDIVNDISVVDETSDVDFSNKDKKYGTIVEAEEVAKDFGNGEILEF